MFYNPAAAAVTTHSTTAGIFHHPPAAHPTMFVPSPAGMTTTPTIFASSQVTAPTPTTPTHVTGAATSGFLASPPPISTRGRERYCSGGAWVGPAPEWPKAPSEATIDSVDVSRVPPNRRPFVDALTARYRAALASPECATNPVRRKELEGIASKMGGLFYFCNPDVGEGEVSDAVSGLLLRLCGAMGAGDAHEINAIVLFLSSHHWEEVSNWLPSLKRLIKL